MGHMLKLAAFVLFALPGTGITLFVMAPASAVLRIAAR
jgi:hypothetical protein